MLSTRSARFSLDKNFDTWFNNPIKTVGSNVTWVRRGYRIDRRKRLHSLRLIAAVGRCTNCASQSIK